MGAVLSPLNCPGLPTSEHYERQIKPLFPPSCMLSRSRLFATLWIVTPQAPLSMGFSRQEYWSGMPCPPPGDLPNTGIEPMSPALQADSLPAEPLGKPETEYFIC